MELKEIIGQLRRQLREAETTEEDAMFFLDGCEIELGVDIKVESDGGMNISILGIGGKIGAKAARTSSHKIILRFKPISSLGDSPVRPKWYLKKREDVMAGGGAEGGTI